MPLKGSPQAGAKRLATEASQPQLNIDYNKRLEAVGKPSSMQSCKNRLLQIGEWAEDDARATVEKTPSPRPPSEHTERRDVDKAASLPELSAFRRRDMRAKVNRNFQMWAALPPMYLRTLMRAPCPISIKLGHTQERQHPRGAP